MIANVGVGLGGRPGGGREEVLTGTTDRVQIFSNLRHSYICSDVAGSE